MALTITINDDQINLSSGTNLVYCKTNTSGVYKFRYLLELTYHTKVEAFDYESPVSKTISFTQQQNNSGDAVFNLSEIYKTIVTPQITTDVNQNDNDIPLSIHNLPTTADGNVRLYSGGLISSNGLDSFRGIANVLTLKFYEMYSSTATGIPTKQAGTEVSKTIYLLYGRGLESEGVVIDFMEYNFEDDTPFMSSNYNKTRIGGAGQNTMYEIDIAKDDYHTMGFLNSSAKYETIEGHCLVVEYFDSSDSSLGTLSALIDEDSGGIVDDTINDERFILFVGVGLSNLQQLNTSQAEYSGTKPDSVAGGRSAISYYKVVMSQDTDYSNMVSAEYKFNVKTYCGRYDVTRIAFMNRFGFWEYINLNREKDESLKIKKEYVTQPYINPETQEEIELAGSYPPTMAKQGKMVSSVSYEETMTLFTDNLEDYQINQIQDLMMSPQIHLLDGANAKALILETSDMKLKGDKNTGLYQYELKFKYAIPKYRTL